MLDYALEYLSKGWPIFPISKTDKNPLVEWGRFQEVLPTEDQVRSWWASWPDANIGLATGRLSGVIVVDVDPRHGGEFAGNSSLRSTTPRGGYHLYYRYPEVAGRLPSPAGIYPGVDVRADGGMVVLPPSHTDNGDYEWFESGSPSILPADISAAVMGWSKEDNEPGWIAKALAGAVDGSRNWTIAKLAGYFAHMNIPMDITELIMHQWNKSNIPPLVGEELREINKAVKSVYKAEDRKKASGPTNVFSLMSLKDFMLKYWDDVGKWNIKDWLPEGTIAFIVAPPGHWKTWIILDLAVSVAMGYQFLGRYPVEFPGPVFLMQQEDPFGDIAQRVASIVRARSGWSIGGTDDNFEISMVPDVPMYIHTDRRFRFGDNTVADALEARIAEYRPKLVILDPLYSAASTKNYMEEALQYMFRIKTWRDKYGCSFLIAHHTTKGTRGSEADREQAWGSQFLNAFLETGWQIRGIEGKRASVVLQRHFKMAANIAPSTLSFDVHTEEPYRYSVSVESRDDLGPELVLKALTGRTATARELAVDLGRDLSILKTLLREMEQEGLLVRRGAHYESMGEAPDFD